MPSDLLILRPLSSITTPWMYTSLKGISPMNLSPLMIILATQKKSMPGSVTRTEVG